MTETPANTQPEGSAQPLVPSPVLMYELGRFRLDPIRRQLFRNDELTSTS